MIKYMEQDEWRIVEKGFDPARHEASESIFSLGNGLMGQRANFEEQYSGPSLRGSYIAGVYYPDKTRVGWWKNGYPEYFAKVLNSPNWIGLAVIIEEVSLDLYTARIEDFERVLDMKRGLLTRSFTATLPNGYTVKVKTERFLSMHRPETGVMRFTITPVNFSGNIDFVTGINGNVINEDANYGEQFWNILHTEAWPNRAVLLSQTKKLDFRVALAMNLHLVGKANDIEPMKEEMWSGNVIQVAGVENESIVFTKYVGVCSSLNHPHDQLITSAQKESADALEAGFEHLLKEHEEHWENIWHHSDIKIEGDAAAQQGIRFNIFHLNQTYTGKDERLNIGPKGFTGEKYGGSTYWDTEAYCIPFFLATAPPQVTRNLLLYRYKHLPKAIENAQKLGFTDGAALYPMVTMNGEESHNEWEITFQEIHRNGAIAFAIHNYIRHTGDEQYLDEYGLEVLIAIARFWSQRATFSQVKKQFVILGVTGPNEYENNINNNWYTNKIAVWCLNFTLSSIQKVKKRNPEHFGQLVKKTRLDQKIETKLWQSIADNMYFPFYKEQNVFLQQEGYMDKEQIMAHELNPAIRPINQHWSWDRILRSCFIKQADTLQGIYLFEELFDTETIRRNFNFYEPRTVHESSLSPCVHNILAARTGDVQKAYELYLRTSRLDLDDYNLEVHEGLHITSMAGTWMSIVEGFGGKRVYDDGRLRLAPVIPQQWQAYSFRIHFRGNQLEIKVSKENVEIISHASQKTSLIVYDKPVEINAGESCTIPLNPDFNAK